MIVSVCAGQRLSSDTSDRSDTTVRLRARFDRPLKESAKPPMREIDGPDVSEALWLVVAM
jgi:hypothetical protein